MLVCENCGEEFDPIKTRWLCPFCREVEKRKWVSDDVPMLAVDHNHLTGKIRGLLCSNCNTALGKFRDSSELLQAAIDYLEEYQ